MSTPRKGRRQLAGVAENLSARDLAILTTTAELRLVTARQLERLHFAGRDGASTVSAARRARRSLERLVQDQLLLRLDRRIGGLRAGSASFIYAIAPAGQRVIVNEGPRRRFREPSAMFVQHTLAVADLYVRLHEIASEDRDLRLTAPIQAEPRCWRAFSGPSGRVTVKPDLFVSLASGGYEYRWFVEVDLGTEHRPAIIRKTRAYEAYYRSGVEQATHGVFPQVLWMAPDDARAREIGRAIRHSGQLTPNLFLIAGMTAAMVALTRGRL